MFTAWSCWGQWSMEFSSGTGTLKDAVNETMREWTRRMEDTLYVLGSVMGPSSFSYDGPGFPEGDRKKRYGNSLWKRKGAFLTR